MWRVRRGGRTYGPMSRARIRTLYESGKISADDEVCKEGGSDWVTVRLLLGVPEETATINSPQQPSVSEPPPAEQPPVIDPAPVVQQSRTSVRQRTAHTAIRRNPSRRTNPVVQFLLFDKNLSLYLLIVLWMMGALGMTFWAIGQAVVVWTVAEFETVAERLGITLLGVLGWVISQLAFRLVMEAIVLFFKMADNISEIHEILAHGQDDSEPRSILGG